MIIGETFKILFIYRVMSISKALLSIAGITAGAAILINLPTQFFMATEKATLQYLQTAKLQTIDQTKNNFSVSALCIT